MEPKEFIERFGGIYEHSTWVAEAALASVDDDLSSDSLAALFAQIVDSAPEESRLALIRAHPDLAGRAAISGTLTAESNYEQASAGIDQCTPEEFARLQDLNERYKSKFDFPFVMAVRNSNRQAILSAIESRLQNDPDVEFDCAITEIHKIAKLRLEAMTTQ